MGKSPGKWIKSIFRGKKKSILSSKENDISKSANKGETLVSSKGPVSDTTVEHSLLSQLVPTAGAKSGVHSEHGVAAKAHDEKVALSSVKGNENSEGITNLGSQEDVERIKHETAAIKAQAAIRGFLARREFESLKGVIRLQALIRGHLVRRQAVATLGCVQAVIKLQALARGLKVRRSAVGIEVQSTCNLGKIQGVKCSTSSGTYISVADEKLIKNSFAQKLLASSKGSVPLHLQYSSRDPNSSQEWTERWTRSRFWESRPQQKKTAKHDKEKKQGRPKRSVQKQSRANAENGSVGSAKESTKPKRNPRKLSSNPDGSVKEPLQNESEKGNHNVRKSSDSPKKNGEKYDADSGKKKRTVGKPSTVTTEVPEGADMAVAVIQVPDVDETSKVPTVDDEVGESHQGHDLDLEPIVSNGKIDDTEGADKPLIHKDKCTGSESQKISDRRTSFPLNIEHQENGTHGTPKLPSYMASTESARARLRGQGSPRFSEDVIENTGPTTTRRHSLPSSINGKFSSMSPRASKLVNSAGKGVIRSDRSLSASRDGSVSDKMVKPEWRR